MNHSPIQQFIEGLSSAFVNGDRNVENKSLEATNVARLQAMLQHIANEDLNSFSECLDEEIEFTNAGPDNIPFVNRAAGKEEVVKAIAYNFSLLDNQHPTATSVVAQGDTVVVFGQEEGTFRETGQEYHMEWVQEFTFADNKLTRFRQVLDSATLMQAAGVLS